MQIEKLALVFDDNGDAYIAVKIDNQEARIYLDQKKVFVDMGYVFLNPAAFWENKLPPIDVPPDEDKPPITLRGFIYSTELANLVRIVSKRLADGTAKPGPLSLRG